jgi:hypothetical protein
MAKPKKPVSPSTQGSGGQKHKGNGILFGLVAVLVATFIFVAIIGGTAYYAISKNVNGIAVTYRKQISTYPILRWALPALKDPYDPKYLTNDQLKTKYNELRTLNAELTKQLTEANTKITDLQKVKADQDKIVAENEKLKSEAVTQKAQIEAEKTQLASDKKAIDELIAKGDKAGFKAYFEKVDKVTAAKIYTQILTEQKVNDAIKENAKLYNTMDASASAQIFEQIGTKKMDLVVETIKNMNQAVASEVMAAMTPAFAAKVAEKLRTAYTAP